MAETAAQFGSTGNLLSHKELVEAKKKRTQIPGYDGVKTGHKVESFLKREAAAKSTARNVNQSFTQPEISMNKQLSSANQF